jgi:hypothetical protein
MARARLLARRLFAGSLLAAAAASFAPAAGQAADDHQPHRTVHSRHHARRSTGDSQVDRLNESQLDANYRGPWRYMNGPSGSPPPPTPYTAPPLLPGGRAAPPPGAYGGPR